MKQEHGKPVGRDRAGVSEQRLFHRLQRTARRLQKAADRAFLESAGVTTAQAAVLALVGDGTAVTQRDVALQLGLNESAITALVDRLERAGVIARARNPTDGRAWRLILTLPGQQALERARAPMAAINRRLDRAAPPAERAVLLGCLDRIEAEFGDASDDGAGVRHLV